MRFASMLGGEERGRARFLGEGAAGRARPVRALARRLPAAVAAGMLDRRVIALPRGGSCLDRAGWLGRSRCQSAGHSTSPSTWTSGSSTTPKRSWTRRRPSAISARTSAVVASPAFSTKLACFGEKRAPPTWSPRQPAASSSWPAVLPSARASSGFLKVEPKVLIPDGCASRRCVAHLRERAP